MNFTTGTVEIFKRELQQHNKNFAHQAISIVESKLKPKKKEKKREKER